MVELYTNLENFGPRLESLREITLRCPRRRDILEFRNLLTPVYFCAQANARENQQKALVCFNCAVLFAKASNIDAYIKCFVRFNCIRCKFSDGAFINLYEGIRFSPQYLVYKAYNCLKLGLTYKGVCRSYLRQNLLICPHLEELESEQNGHIAKPTVSVKLPEGKVLL